MGGEELEITIKNLSITGVLAELNNSGENTEVRDIFNNLLASTLIDFYLPEMRLAGEVEVSRVDLLNNHIFLALEFKTVAYDIDNLLYKRKAYRKHMPGPGQILLNKKYREFNAVNVSVEGLMIRLDEIIAVEEGAITLFKFPQLELEGEIKIVWVDYSDNCGTLIGLQYMHMGKTLVKGIPRFAPPQTA
ncbi:PilZ domain-containing protein [Candidatus Methylobacter favarea]|nr:PilZ domain-containing protein [Candidatus Methylobacter favarea]